MQTDTYPKVGRWTMLLGIVALAIFLRLWGVNFGLPQIYNVDEAENILVIHTIFTAHQLNPGVFYYPSLFYYIQALAYPPYFLTSWITGEIDRPGEIHGPVMINQGVGIADRPMLFLMGRLITVIFAVGCVILAFHIAQQITQHLVTGALAAYLIAVSPLHAELSHYIAPDMIVTFFVLAAAWGSLRVYQRGATRDYVLAGIMCGLAASAKYNGGMIVVALAAAHFLRPGSRGLRDSRIYGSVILSSAAFLATTPYALLDYRAFRDGLEFNSTHYTSGHAGMEGNTVGYYLDQLSNEGLATLLGGAAFAVAVVKRDRPIIVLASFPVSYFLFISQFTVRNNRTLLPALPFLLIAAAVFTVRLWTWIAARTARQGQRWLQPFGVGITVLALSVPLYHTATFDHYLSEYDVRAKAMYWLDNNLPTTARIAIEPYTPYLNPARFPNIVAIEPAFKYTPQWFTDHEIDYVVFTSATYSPYFRDREKYADQIARYQDLFNAFDLITTITSSGYEVRVYEVPAT